MLASSTPTPSNMGGVGHPQSHHHQIIGVLGGHSQQQSNQQPHPHPHQTVLVHHASSSSVVGQSRPPGPQGTGNYMTLVGHFITAADSGQQQLTASQLSQQPIQVGQSVLPLAGVDESLVPPKDEELTVHDLQLLRDLDRLHIK